MANKVRCANESIAEEVAALLKIPVKRITVTPWSWALPDPPQSNYLAFLQEDHDRCDCQADTGKVVQGQGFRKVKEATNGWMVDKDTAVMTVSQYQAMTGTASTGGSAAGTGASAGAAGTAPVGVTTTTTTQPSSRAIASVISQFGDAST